MVKSRATETKPKKGLSRRDFLSRGAGLAVTAPVLTGVGLPAPAGPAADVKISGPGKVPVSLKINGFSAAPRPIITPSHPVCRSI